MILKLGKLPKDILVEIVSYLELKDIENLIFISKEVFRKIYYDGNFWKNRVNIDFIKTDSLYNNNSWRDYYHNLYKDKESLKIGYNKMIVKIFNSVGQYIHNLPIFNIGDRMGRTDYIDFITCEELDFPIMKFIDKYKRPGIVLRIQGKTEDQINFGYVSLICKNIIGVIVLFQRHKDENFWTFACDPCVKKMIEYYHNFEHIGNKYLECTKCPFHGFTLNDDILSSLLTNTNKYYKLKYNDN